MIPCRVVLPCLAIALAFAAHGQHDRLAERHTRIHDLYEQERYAEMIRETDALLNEAKGTPYQDSLHRYLYKYGRAQWKTNGAEAGVAAAERLWSLVERWDRDPRHRISALGDLSWIYYELGRLRECVRVDSLALNIAEQHASDIPLTMLGKANQYLAFDHDALGDHARALHYFQAALRTYERSDTLLVVNRAETHTGIGVSYWRMGRTRDAERHYDLALELLATDTSIAGLARKASAYGNMGILWQDAGDLPRSKAYYQQSIDLGSRIIASTKDPFKRDEAVFGRAKGYLNLATVYHITGDRKHARELLERSLKDRLTVLQPDDPQVLRIHERFADLEAGAHEYDKAEQLLRTYINGCEKRYGRRNAHYALACSKLAEVVAAKGDVSQADSLFRVSIAISQEVVGGTTDPKLAETYRSRAAMYLDNGWTVLAMEDIARSRAILQQVHGPQSHHVAEADVMLARAAFITGDTAGARACSDTALRNLRDRVEALSNAAVPRLFAKPHLLPDAIYWKVRAERAGPRSAAKEEAWLAELDLAITSLQRNKTALTDEASRLLLIGAQKRLFDLGLEIAYERYQRTHDEHDLQRFFDLSEADRSILLKGRLNAFSGLRFAGMPDEVIAREQQLIKALDIDPDAPDASRRLLANEEAYADFLDTLAHDHPRYFALRYGDEPVSLKEARERLVTHDRQLLIYAGTDDKLFALVVRHDTTILTAVRNEGVAEAVRVLNASVADRDAETYLNAAHDLYLRLFGPVSKWITGDELLIVPDGPLHTINFEVLLAAPSTPHDFRDHLLLKRYAIANLLSVTTAVQFARLDAPRKGDVLAVAPGFTDELKQQYLAGVKDTAHIDRSYMHLVRQPFTVRTAQGLERMLSAQVLLGAQATEARFRERATDHGVLHLGTHAEMNPIAPMYSRLVLSKDNDTSGMDGYLHAYEIYELDLNAQLAVLTACETGTGRNDDGEGVRSLGHAFAYAGCPSLVMSLWKIDEKVSSEIIERFYRYLAKGMPKHKALQQAKLDHLSAAQDELVLPYYWAGMVLVGDVAPVEVSGSTWIWWILGGLLLLGLLFWWRRWR